MDAADHSIVIFVMMFN